MMKTISTLLCLVLLLISCKTNKKEKSTLKISTQKVTDDYEVINATTLLILFPGGGSASKDTKREFKIIKPAIKNGISLLLMNFSNHLWIKNKGCIQLSTKIETAINNYELPIDKVYIGEISLDGKDSLFKNI